MTLLLGLDLGTTNIKAVVADLSGNILAESSRQAEISLLPDSVALQDSFKIIGNSREAIRDAVSQVDSRRIASIGISSQGGAMQLLSPDNEPIGPVIGWMDKRGGPHDVEFTKKMGPRWLSQRIGRGRSGMAIGQILRLRQESPESIRSPNKIGFLGDVVTSSFCGRPATDATSLGLTMLYNPYKNEYDGDLLRELGIASEQLPELIDCRVPAGFLLPEIAGELGLTPGIPVSAAVHDQYAASLGVGAVLSGDIMFGAGTAWVLLAISDRIMPSPSDDVLLCTHIIPGLFGQILSLVNGGSAFRWGTELLALADRTRDEMDQLILSAPPGCSGLRFRPLLTSFDVLGVRPGTRGRLNGLQLYHDKTHLMRSIVEGLACELNRFLSILHDSGVIMKRLIMCGKAGESVVTPQILADIIDHPVHCVSYSGASALGAAMIAAGILDPTEPLRAISEKMATGNRIVEPGENRHFYRELKEEYITSLPTA